MELLCGGSGRAVGGFWGGSGGGMNLPIQLPIPHQAEKKTELTSSVSPI